MHVVVGIAVSRAERSWARGLRWDATASTKALSAITTVACAAAVPWPMVTNGLCAPHCGTGSRNDEASTVAGVASRKLTQGLGRGEAVRL